MLRNQNWDCRLMMLLGAEDRDTQAQLYSGLPWAEDGLGSAKF